MLNRLTDERMEQIRQPYNLIERAMEEGDGKSSTYQRRANAIGAAAVLALPGQVDDRITELAGYELARGLYDLDNLYIQLLQGAPPFTMKYFSALAEQGVHFSSIDMSDPNDPEVHIDSSAINISRRRGKPKIVQRLPDEDRTADRHVLLCDGVVNEGVTLRFVADYLLGGRRSLGLLGLTKEGPARSVGVRALVSKGIADMSMFEETDTLICFEATNVRLSEMGMDEEKEIIDKSTRKARLVKEAYRYNEGISISRRQEIKNRDSVEETLIKLDKVGRVVAGMDKIEFVDSAYPHRRPRGPFYGRFVDLKDRLRAAA